MGQAGERRGKGDRAEKLAQALRANLRRRKAPRLDGPEEDGRSDAGGAAGEAGLRAEPEGPGAKVETRQTKKRGQDHG